jgi:hypothetical protein
VAPASLPKLSAEISGHDKTPMMPPCRGHTTFPIEGSSQVLKKLRDVSIASCRVTQQASANGSSRPVGVGHQRRLCDIGSQRWECSAQFGIGSAPRPGGTSSTYHCFLSLLISYVCQPVVAARIHVSLKTLQRQCPSSSKHLVLAGSSRRGTCGNRSAEEIIE